ncbi:MAG TPA: UDP-N-acetylmuramoyl-L-alanyl-D-glutamate--2,6-diaminopimelate ligase [Mariniphaga sp.]|nr:UDP-N-acetylmuramoyl-L-alanyl-D-glutamate--2,6-diaminopimelate ligase [Mariniphaga sp.]
MKLQELLQHINYLEVKGDDSTEVESLEFDSRKITPGALFIAQRGLHSDGHRFIEPAIEKGATTIVCEEFPSTTPTHITFVKVADSIHTTGLLASAFYNFPSSKMKVIGITGTNGKTSIATLLFRLFRQLGYNVGLISTITYRINETEEAASFTTPDPLKIQKLMAEMVNAGCGYCFMEVSSHAVHQRRIGGIEFAGGVFTNITHDHLDYHKTFSEYIKAKQQFFDVLPSDAFVLTNADDKNGRIMVQNTKAKVFTYSNRAVADYHCKILESHFDGMLLNLNGQEVWTRFVGKFNAYNLLAVFAVAVILNQDEQEVYKGISNLNPVKGRFETIRSIDGKLAIVDYAHTPDALTNVLSAIAGIRTGSEQVITVVGAGGDRDRTKRPEMAKEAVMGSDKVILTSDNPRTEDPGQILREMEAGIEKRFSNKVATIENRREAIKMAVMMANPGDIILIAGKGHENYQEVHGVRHHFDDVEEVKRCFGIED